MNKPTTKTVNYIVRINNEFHKAFASLREARSYVRYMGKSYLDAPVTVEIVKQAVIDSVMNIYTSSTINVLTVNDFGDL